MAATIAPPRAGTKPASTAFPRSTAAPPRYVALDAYRGLIMICLVSVGFGFGALDQHPFWGAVARQVEHVPWEGMVFWDLIQPAFMFMVGVAMPFSFANRAGASTGQQFRRVLWRSAKLVILANLFGVVHGQFQFGLINVLAQIAFTYLLCFLIMQLPLRAQIAATVGLLVSHWALFVIFPGPEGAFSKTGNIGQVIDQAILGRTYSGHYVTINFLSSAVTTMFGVWAGMLVRSARSNAEKMKWLALAAVSLFVAGYALTPVAPMVKRIWTASFTLASAGLVVAGLLAFFWLVEVRGWRRGMFPLTVVGMNSITAYVIFQTLRGNIDRAIAEVTGRFVWAGTLAPVYQACATLAVIWGICYLLYRRRWFIRL